MPNNDKDTNRDKRRPRNNKACQGIAKSTKAPRDTGDTKRY